MQVKCSGCGTQLAIKQELLGKKIKCPTCQCVLSIAAPKPSPKTPVASRPASAPRSAPPAGATLLKCGCGTSLKVPASAAGKNVRCPKCQTLLKAPAAPASSAPSAPTPQATPAAPLPAAPTVPAAPSEPQAPQAGDPFGDVSWDALPTGPTLPAPGSAAAFPPAAAANPYAKKPAKGKPAKGKPAKSKTPEKASKGVSGPSRDWGEVLFKRMHLFMFIMLLGGPVAIFVGMQSRQKLSVLKERGEQVVGVIIDGEETHRRRSHSYSLTVRFPTKDGTPSVSDFSVDETYYESHDLQSEVQVLYDPQDIENAVLVGQEGNPFFGILFGIGATLAGLLGTLYIFFVGDINL